MSFDVSEFKANSLGDGSPRMTLFELVIRGHEHLRFLTSKVHLSYTSSTDNIVDRILKMTMMENSQFDAFKFLNAAGTQSFPSELKMYNNKGEPSTINVSFKVDFFRTNLDWEKPNELVVWDVFCKVSSLY